MMAEHGERQHLRNYDDDEPLPRTRSEVASAGVTNLLGNLGWVALDSSQSGPVVRAFAGLRQVLTEEPFYMNQEIAAEYSAQSKRTMFASKGHRRDGDVVVAFGEPTVADRLCRLGFARTPGDHLTFVTDERTGRVSARADEWTFDDAADLPLYSRAALDVLIQGQYGQDPTENRNNNSSLEGQICDLVHGQRLRVITRPTTEAWSRPGGNDNKGARRFNDTAFRLWLVLLSFFPETPLWLTPALVAEVFKVSNDTSRRALGHLADLELIATAQTRPTTHRLLYRWDLRSYFASLDERVDAMGDATGHSEDYPWRPASLGNQPPRRGAQHVDDYFDQNYALDAARKQGIGRPFTTDG